MPLRRRAWFTREGWYYAAVLTFIVAGAVLKSVNLLVVLAGMMIAPLFINWRLAMASLAGLSVRRKLPEQICAGEPLVVDVIVENPRRWMSSWMLTVEDWVERESRIGSLAAGVGLRKGAQVSRWDVRKWLWHALSPRRLLRLQATLASTVITHVPAYGRATETYRVTLHRRGRYRFGPLRISTSFPLGLVAAHFTQPADAELIVAPRVGRLSPEWLQLIEAELVGDQRRHPQRGISEGDYYGLRPWQSGDSMRWVHWRTTAKLGRPIVRQFERRRNRDVAILLDPWLPDHFGERDEGLLELAISLAATGVADLTSRGHSRLTFVVAGEQPECWAGAASPLFCQELLAKLADVEPVSGSFLAAALERLIEEAPVGCRLVIVSPRAAASSGTASAPIELDCDPENFCWIDVSSDQLSSLFLLD